MLGYARISFVLFLLLAFSIDQVAARRPNVVVILTDDQGTVDLGIYDSSDLKTPHLDRLAKSGVRFTQFYAAAAICSPSRAALLTGRYPWLVGVPGNAPAPPPESLDQLTGAVGHNALPAEAFTMAELFHEAGYATAHIGKWHLGWGTESRPNAQGFEYSFGHLGGCIDNYTHFFYWSGPNRHDLWENDRRVRLPGRYFPDLMVEKAATFIEKHRERPFFLYFATNLPHYPYQSDARWSQHYAGHPAPRRLYAATLSALDERIGHLIGVLEQLGLREKTIIVFQSDHGHSVEERAHHGGGDNGPYRGAKFSLFEGGIRVPAIISWPEKIPAGAVRDQMAHGCDWFPTLAELCQVPLPEERQFDGRSLASIIKDPRAASPHDHLIWKMGQQWAIRQGAWKLIHQVRDSAKDGPSLTAADRKWFLANIEEDPGEIHNLAASEPQVVARLRSLIDSER